MKYSVLDNTIGGKIFVIEYTNLIVHVFLEPLFGTCSNIIESSQSLLIIDTFHTLLLNYSLLDYISSLNKPIDAVILSNAHPTHFAALELFSDKVPIYALPSTISKIKAESEIFPLVTFTKEKMTKRYRFPDKEITQDTILTFHDTKIEFLALGPKLLVWIPDHKLLFGQDLFFNEYHAFIPSTLNKLDLWIETLHKFNEYAVPSLIFSGHGAPRNEPQIFYKNMIEYLTFVKNLLSDRAQLTRDQYRTLLKNKFVEYRGIEVLQFYLDDYFPE